MASMEATAATIFWRASGSPGLKAARSTCSFTGAYAFRRARMSFASRAAGAAAAVIVVIMSAPVIPAMALRITPPDRSRTPSGHRHDGLDREIDSESDERQPGHDRDDLERRAARQLPAIVQRRGQPGAPEQAPAGERSEVQHLHRRRAALARRQARRANPQPKGDGHRVDDGDAEP